VDYKTSGVDIAEADCFVHWIKNKVKSSSYQSQILEGIGGFSALFPTTFKDMKEPCLAATTDGVGTKLKLASYFRQYWGVGQDLVAMCLNDLICCGAKPLFFMDYYACRSLNQKVAREFLEGVHSACEKGNCLLLGGETAEMPGCYEHLDFDCAGFAIGVVERSKRLGAHNVKVSDKIIGVSSSGFHSNGFSLLRRVFEKDLHIWKEELLKPTALYVALAQDLSSIKGLRAMAHITGGGINNLLRVLPKGVTARLKAWDIPQIFLEVKKRTQMKWIDMLKTFNCGIGFVLVASSSDFELICERIRKNHFFAYDLGEIFKEDSIENIDLSNSRPKWSASFSDWPSL